MANATTAKQLRNLIDQYAIPGTGGLIAAIKRSAQTGQTSSLTSAQQQFLADAEKAAAASRDAQAGRQPYRHPALDPRVLSAAGGNRAATRTALADTRLAPDAPSLSASQVAFLTRLPEPAATSFEDAVRVYAMQAGGVNATDEPLLTMIVEPLRALHDRAAAHATLETLGAAPVPLPGSAVGALAPVIASENTQLSTDEASARAKTEVDKISAARTYRHDQERQALHKRISDVDEADRKRLATTR